MNFLKEKVGVICLVDAFLERGRDLLNRSCESADVSKRKLKRRKPEAEAMKLNNFQLQKES